MLGLVMLLLPLRWAPLQGQIACMEVSDLDFGVLHPGDTISRPLQICNFGQGTITFNNPAGGDVLTWLDRNFSVSSADLELLKQAKLGANQCVTIMVLFKAPKPGGMFRTTARFWGSTRDCRDTSVWHATVTEPEPAITGFDWKQRWLSSHNPCTKNVAPSYDSVVVVSNNGTGDYTIARIELLGNDASSFAIGGRGDDARQGDIIRPGEQNARTLRVAFMPTEERSYKAELRLTTTDGATVSAFLTGIGIESHGSIDAPLFGPIPPAASVTRNVEIKSTGSRPLTVSSIVLTGLTITPPEGFSYGAGFVPPSDATPWVITPGDSMSIPIAFSWGVEGTKQVIVKYSSPDGSNCDNVVDTLEGIASLSSSVADRAKEEGSARIAGIDPNPFNGGTTITVVMNRSGRGTIGIYSAGGKKVATLFDGSLLAGEHQVRWEPAGLASGGYYCRIDAAGTSQTRMLVLVR